MDTFSALDVYAAARNLHGIVRKTPCEHAHTLSQIAGASIYLKLECLQKTGSFKIRGAWNKIATMAATENPLPMVTASAGNHAQGVGFAASRLQLTARIFVPETIPRNKLDAINRYDVQVVLKGSSYDDAHQAAVDHARQTGAVYIDAFNDPLIMAGHGTIGIEMLEQVPDLEGVIIPVGGGGLMAGVATYLKTANPGLEIIGCQSTASCAMARSLEENRAYLTFDSKDTIAEGLEGGISQQSFELGKQLIDRMVLVEEADIRGAIRFLLKEHRLVVEGSGAVGVAALLKGTCGALPKKTALIITGGNLDYSLLTEIVTEG